MRVEDLPDYMLVKYRELALRGTPGAGLALRAIDDEINRRANLPPATALSLTVIETLPIERKPLDPFVPDLDAPLVGFIGIDPGMYSGAIALITSHGDVIVVNNDASGKPRKAMIDPRQHEFLAGLGFPCVAFVEMITPILFRKNKETGEKEPISPDSSLMQSYGAFCALVESLRIPYRRVRALTWQEHMGCRSGGRKIVTRDRARAVFLSRYRGDISHKTADALLIADFCYRVMKGELEVKSWGKNKVLRPWLIS